MKQLMQDYGKYLELEGEIPRLEKQCAEMAELVREKKQDSTMAKLEVECWNDPGFFQRLLRNVPEKQEKARAAHNRAMAEYAEENRKLEEKQHQLKAFRQELAALESSKDAWLAKKQQLTAPEEETFSALAKEVFGPAAVAAATGCIEALENARSWMQVDAVRKGVREGNRKLEFLEDAAKAARRLVWVLEQLPQGSVEVNGTYLKNPEGYVTGATSEFKQLDLLNMAQEQVRAVRKQLR